MCMILYKFYEITSAARRCEQLPEFAQTAAVWMPDSGKPRLQKSQRRNISNSLRRFETFGLEISRRQRLSPREISFKWPLKWFLIDFQWTRKSYVFGKQVSHLGISPFQRTLRREGFRMHIPLPSTLSVLFGSLGPSLWCTLFAIPFATLYRVSMVLCESAQIHPVSRESQVHKSHDLFVMIFIWFKSKLFFYFSFLILRIIRILKGFECTSSLSHMNGRAMLVRAIALNDF